MEEGGKNPTCRCRSRELGGAGRQGRRGQGREQGRAGGQQNALARQAREGSKLQKQQEDLRLEAGSCKAALTVAGRLVGL